MTTLTVYDPAMCCSTGLCGTDIDQRLVDLAADLDWLKTQGVSVRRFGLSREPTEFAANDNIRQIMQESDGDDLPVFMLDGALKAKARYPSRAEMAEWVGLSASTPEDPASTPAPAKEMACCGGTTVSAPAKEKGKTCC